MTRFIETLEYFPRGLVYVALGIVVLYIAKWILDFVTPYHVSDQLGEKDNTALGLSIMGYFLGVIIVFVAVLYTPFVSGGRVPVAVSTPTSGTTCWRSSSIRSAR